MLEWGTHPGVPELSLQDSLEHTQMPSSLGSLVQLVRRSSELSHGLGVLCGCWGTPKLGHGAAAASAPCSLSPKWQMCDTSLAGRKGKRDGLSDREGPPLSRRCD